MNGVLTPHAALAYLRELSPAVTAAALLDPSGDLRAGDPSLAVAGAGPVCARGERGTLVAELAPGALVALAQIDAGLALGAVRDRC